MVVVLTCLCMTLRHSGWSPEYVWPLGLVGSKECSQEEVPCSEVAHP